MIKCSKSRWCFAMEATIKHGNVTVQKKGRGITLGLLYLSYCPWCGMKLAPDNIPIDERGHTPVRKGV